MGSHSVCWEDDDNNRKIDLDIRFGMVDGEVEIHSITPHTVSFVCPEKKDIIRKIGVFTEAGRQMLAAQFKQRNCMNTLKSQLSDIALAAV